MTQLDLNDLATLLPLVRDQRALTAGQRESLSQERDSAATRNLRRSLDDRLTRLDHLIEKLETLHRERLTDGH